MKTILTLTLLILAAVVPTTQAQAGFKNIYVFDAGTTFNYPDPWQVYEDDDGYVHLASTDTDVRFWFYLSDNLQELGVKPGDVAGALQADFAPIDSTIQFDPAQVQTTQLGGMAAVSYSFLENNQGDQYERMLIGVVLLPDQFIFASVVPNQGVNLTETDMVLAILNTLTPPFGSDDSLDSFSWGSGVSVIFPDHWEVYMDEDGYIHLSSDASDLLFTFFAASDLPSMGVSMGDEVGLLKSAFSPIDTTITFDAKTVETFKLWKYDAATQLYTENNQGDVYQRLRIAVTVNDTLMVIVSAVPQTGTKLTEFADVLAIVGSLRPPSE